MSKLQGLGIFYFATQKFHLFIPNFFCYILNSEDYSHTPSELNMAI